MPGRMDEMKGSVKEAAGKAVGNDRLKAEGKADKTAGKTARETEGAVDQIAGNVKKAAGKMTDDEKLHAEGQKQDLKGRVKSIG